MIGQLKGIVEQLDTGTALIDVQGVGYTVHASTRTLGSLSAGQPARLLIETQVREDAITLFGFASAAEQQMFRTLTTVQGVGAKVGLALLSALSPSELSQCILLEDAKSLTRADGVGNKLAVRIVNELKDKLAKAQGMTPIAATPTLVVANDAAQDAIAALVNLGYRRADVVPVVTLITAKTPDAGVQTVIKSALQELAA
ncbi:MAG: Holliday junction branch migration protein RuvA [Bdellovibrionales bacterium]